MTIIPSLTLFFFFFFFYLFFLPLLLPLSLVYILIFTATFAVWPPSSLCLRRRHPLFLPPILHRLHCRRCSWESKTISRNWAGASRPASRFSPSPESPNWLRT
ncbi:hypothetical protein RchiOBHm_Chr4g0415931 [Rosa chinensis]|uniref:Uncharacterized protein n=1 Tax=Rosa chinensis TaxID=74649 RepID=A0A2P6QWS7_ROSCH|nr:hypothetical protein RchiOBHm_Chr4g0415931 [Rosa chinensis]